jgi:hypothetical protein
MSVDHFEPEPIGIVNVRLDSHTPSPTRVQKQQPHLSAATPDADDVCMNRFALNEVIYAIRCLATPRSLKASTKISLPTCGVDCVT